MDPLESRVLLVAPSGRDALNAAEVLKVEELDPVPCEDIVDMCSVAAWGAGVIVLAQESLAAESLGFLGTMLESQPAWSDLPIIVLTSGGDATMRGATYLRELSARAAVTLLERPLRRVTFVSAVRAALRARRKQYQVRDLLGQRQEIMDQLQLRADSLETSQRELLAAKETISKHAQELEKIVQERTAKLKETNAQLEAFSYSISHDMRGPLRAMQQYSQLLLDEQSSVSEDAREFLHRIARAASRLDRLIQDVLTYSRVARAEITLGEVDLNKLVQEIVHQYPGFQPPQAEIQAQAPLAPVLAHEASLTQCISNLLSNAVKFVPAGKRPEVRLHTACHNGTVRLWIEDNGIGIDGKNHARIFNIFERVYSQAQYEGTGIGLSIVKKTVERMGGAVGLESELGSGTRFWIDLPASHKTPT